MNGAPGSSAAPWAAHSPPASPPAAPVIGTPRGSRGKLSRELVEALRQPLDQLRVGALLRPEHLGAALPRDLHVAEHDDLRAAQAAGRPRSPRSAPAPPSVVAEPPTATRITCAPRSTAAAISWPVP